MNFQQTLQHLATRQPLNEAEAERAFEHMLSGRADEPEIAEFLRLVAARGPTVDELVGGARVMRRLARPVPRPTEGPFADAGHMMDTCGTGGAPKLFNISTLCAVIIPSASRGGIMVAKHGNVSRTGRGSAEVLQALGVNTFAPTNIQTRCLGEIGVCFCFAPAHHPAARHVAAARKALGFPTIFNLLGPLANPAGADCQIIGTWSHHNARLMAEALDRLRGGRAWVHSSNDGLDEFTLSDINIVHEVRAGVQTFPCDPREYGFSLTPIERMQVHSLNEAAEVFRHVLDGEPGPHRDATVLSVGAALTACHYTITLDHGIGFAKEALDSGAAKRTLEGLIKLSNS